MVLADQKQQKGEKEMKKVNTEELITRELESYLDGVLSCFDFNDDNLERYVTGKALELLKKLPKEERPFAIDNVLAKPDFSCINDFPYNQREDDFLLPPTEFEIDITNMALEEPDDFYIRGVGGCNLAYYALIYGAFITLDLDKLADYVSDYLNA